MNGSRIRQGSTGVQNRVPDIKVTTETTETATGSPGGATGPMTQALRQRRSNRRHWQMFERVAIVILDAVLIGVAFWLASFFRFTILACNTFLILVRIKFGGVENLPPHSCAAI
jgi:hypothetical protein